MATKKKATPAKSPVAAAKTATKLPPNAQSLPAGAQQAYKKGVAKSGFAGGWTAVKAAYTKNAVGKWVKKK